MMPALNQPWENLAKSYAVRIIAGDLTIDDVPARPATLRPRVEEIMGEMYD